MKKTTALLLILVMILTMGLMTGCGGSGDSNDDYNEDYAGDESNVAYQQDDAGNYLLTHLDAETELGDKSQAISPLEGFEIAEYATAEMLSFIHEDVEDGVYDCGVDYYVSHIDNVEPLWYYNNRKDYAQGEGTTVDGYTNVVVEDVKTVEVDGREAQYGFISLTDGDGAACKEYFVAVDLGDGYTLSIDVYEFDYAGDSSKIDDNIVKTVVEAVQ